MLHSASSRGKAKKSQGLRGLLYLHRLPKGIETLLVHQMIEAFLPAQGGTCGEVKWLKKKGEKRVFLFCQLCKG